MLRENLLTVFARALLGFFLSVVVAVIAFLGGLESALYFGEFEEVNYRLMATFTTSIGAGIGGFLGWLRRDLTVRRGLLLLTMAVSLGVIGGLMGELIEKTILGALLGANAPLVAFGILKAVREA